MATLAAPSPAPPPSFAVPVADTLQAGHTRDCGMGSRMSGKSITLACSACSCDRPTMGASPCLPPAAQDLAGRCSSSLALAMTVTSGLGQRRGCLLGMGRTAGPTALEDFGTRFPPSLAGTQLWWWECVGRNPPVSARLHEGEGRGSLSPSPNPVRLARPGSHSTVLTLLAHYPLHHIPGPREAAGGRECSHPIQTRELPHKERGAKPKHSFTNPMLGSG